MWNLKRWSSPLIKALIPSPFTIFCRLICKNVLREHWRAVGYPNFQPITMERCLVVLCILTENLETRYSSAVLPINLLFSRLIFEKSDRPRFLIPCCYNVDKDKSLSPKIADVPNILQTADLVENIQFFCINDQSYQHQIVTAKYLKRVHEINSLFKEIWSKGVGDACCLLSKLKI